MVQLGAGVGADLCTHSTCEPRVKDGCLEIRFNNGQSNEDFAKVNRVVYVVFRAAAIPLKR